MEVMIFLDIPYMLPVFERAPLAEALLVWTDQGQTTSVLL